MRCRRETLQLGCVEEGRVESREDPSLPRGEGCDSCLRMVDRQTVTCPSQDTNHELAETTALREMLGEIQNIGISSFFFLAVFSQVIHE